MGIELLIALIRRLYAKRANMSLTIHFSDKGEIVYDMKLGKSAVDKFFTEKT